MVGQEREDAMPLPFDATLKDLVQNYLPDFERQLDLTDLGPLRPLNVDLSTITAATDIALAQGDPPTRIVDLNFQASQAEDLGPRVLLYNSLLYYRFRVPVHSLIVLLRPAADDSRLSGRLHYRARSGKGKMDFSYEVVRLWHWPVARLLRGGLGTMPLALLGKFPKVPVAIALADVVNRIFQRLSQEASPTGVAKLLTASYVLSGLRVPKDVADRVFQGVRAMKESTTYQGILEEGRIEGRIEEARRIILRLGRKKFGKPSAAIQNAIESFTNLERLERLTDRLVGASSWQELLETA